MLANRQMEMKFLFTVNYLALCSKDSAIMCWMYTRGDTIRHVNGFNGFVRYSQFKITASGMPTSSPGMTALYTFSGSKLLQIYKCQCISTFRLEQNKKMRVKLTLVLLKIESFRLFGHLLIALQPTECQLLRHGPNYQLSRT